VHSEAGPEAAIRTIEEEQNTPATSPRDRLLHQAFVLFYEKGIRAVGVDLVIAQSGVAKATFYRHFPSKTTLVVAYLDRRHEAFLAWLERSVLTRTADPTERLLAVFDALADLFVDPEFRGCCVLNAVAEVGRGTPEVLEHASACKASLRAFVERLARDAGIGPTAELSEQFSIVIDGAFVAAQRDPGRAPALAARRVASAVLASYR
jgi:AcrR family transcriptional regulator